MRFWRPRAPRARAHAAAEDAARRRAAELAAEAAHGAEKRSLAAQFDERMLSLKAEFAETLERELDEKTSAVESLWRDALAKAESESAANIAGAKGDAVDEIASLKRALATTREAADAVIARSAAEANEALAAATSWRTLARLVAAHERAIADKDARFAEALGRRARRRWTARAPSAAGGAGAALERRRYRRRATRSRGRWRRKPPARRRSAARQERRRAARLGRGGEPRLRCPRPAASPRRASRSPPSRRHRDAHRAAAARLGFAQGGAVAVAARRRGDARGDDLMSRSSFAREGHRGREGVVRGAHRGARLGSRDGGGPRQRAAAAAARARRAVARNIAAWEKRYLPRG